MASAYFVHGNAVTPAESPGGGSAFSPGDLENVNGIGWTDVVGLRQGWGTTFRGKSGKFIWFHIPFPTPTVVNNVQSMLSRLEVFFDINGQATVESVHLWGNTNNRWFMRDNLALRTNARFDFSPPGPLNGVVGISVGVNFQEAANITFRGAMLQLA
jgi:hypothetical protein